MLLLLLLLLLDGARLSFETKAFQARVQRTHKGKVRCEEYYREGERRWGEGGGETEEAVGGGGLGNVPRKDS